MQPGEREGLGEVELSLRLPRSTRRNLDHHVAGLSTREPAPAPLTVRRGALDNIGAVSSGGSSFSAVSSDSSVVAATLSGAALPGTYRVDVLTTGSLTSTFHANARTATLRRHLIHIAARITRSARKTTLHLPTNWPWAHHYTHLFTTTHAPPATPSIRSRPASRAASTPRA